MKRLLLVILATTVIHAQNTIDQIKAKIQEINTLLLSIPEIKPLLDEQAQLYKQMIDIENKTGIAAINKQTTQKEKEICLVREKEIGTQRKALNEKLELLSNQFAKIVQDAFDQSPLKEKGLLTSIGEREEFFKKFTTIKQQVEEKNAPLMQEIRKIEQEIFDLEWPYKEKMNDNTQYRLRKTDELGGEPYEKILQKIEELKKEISLKLVQLKPQANNLLIQLANLKLQLTKENPCEWKEILEELEKLSVLKSRYKLYI